MMHYRKAENIEKQLTKDELPFDDFLPKEKDFLWMHVNGGTKVSNVITYAKNALDKGEHNAIVWSGNGGGVVKTISCAEIIKRSYPLYQVTRMRYITVEEHWKPQTEGLDEIVAKRQVPSLHIYMSLDVIDDSVSGLQKPNSKTDFWIYTDNSDNKSHNAHGSGLSSNSNNNRNQRQRRPPKQQRPSSNPSNAGERQQHHRPMENNEENLPRSSSSHQQNKPKGRKPRANSNQVQTKTQTTKLSNETGTQVESMEA